MSWRLKVSTTVQRIEEPAGDRDPGSRPHRPGDANVVCARRRPEAGDGTQTRRARSRRVVVTAPAAEFQCDPAPFPASGPRHIQGLLQRVGGERGSLTLVALNRLAAQ